MELALSFLRMLPPGLTPLVVFLKTLFVVILKFPLCREACYTCIGICILRHQEHSFGLHQFAHCSHACLIVHDNSLHNAMTFIFMFRPQRYEKKCIFANLCSENLHGGAFFRRGYLQMSEIFCTFVHHFVQKPRLIPCVEKIFIS